MVATKCFGKGFAYKIFVTALHRNSGRATFRITTPGTTLRPTGTITTCPTKRESLLSYVSPSTFPSGITS